jgi:Flp pilus assembly protein TadG
MKMPPRRGSAVVELALCLPFLVGLFLGTLQFGYSFFVYNELQQAVRAGARYASLRHYGSSTATPDSAYLNAVRNVVVYANPAGGTTPVAPGLTTAQVAVSVVFQKNVPVAVRVAVNGYQLPGIVRTVPLTDKPYVEFPYVGAFSPPVS